jgi:hypothetical protein
VVLLFGGLECFIMCLLSRLTSSASSVSKCHITFSMPLMTSFIHHHHFYFHRSKYISEQQYKCTTSI